jgi:hypothetical protein
MSITVLLEWLADTPGSVLLRESQSLFLYPTIESVHVLSLCLFLGLAVMLDLRLLGWTMRRAPVSQVAGRLLPWATFGFFIQIISGGLLFYSNPVRFASNIFFQVKVVLLILAGINVWVFHSTVYSKVVEWDYDASTPLGARVAGAVSLVLWTAIVICGRLIAFYFQ